MENKNNNNNIYAILLGLAFLGLVFFILTISFWEKFIYNLFIFDNYIASIIHQHFPQYFKNYQEIAGLIQFAEIPKFNWLQLKFTYEDAGSGYIDTIYNYYYYLHITYSLILIILGYLLLNNFHLIPVFRFQNFLNYKKKLVKEALKRVEIKNKRIILYKHMDVLLEQKRTAAKIDGKEMFLNADYYLPFIPEDMVGISKQKSDNIKDNFIDINEINTNRRYVNDSLYFSNHYMNYYYKEAVINNNYNNSDILKGVKLIDNYWSELYDKILKNNDVQDLYYYMIISYFNDEISNVSFTFIKLFLLNTNSVKDKNYLVKFNNFLKKYNINMKLVYNYYSENQNNKKLYSEYVIFKEEQKYNKMKDLEKYEFIIDGKYHINLEEFYVLLKIKLFSFSLNKTVFFDIDEEKITVPILNIPPSENNNIEKNKINQLENIKEIINSLKNIQTEEFNELSNIKDKINNFIEFKNNYEKYINSIFYNNKGKKTLQTYLIESLNKTYINIEEEQINVKELIGEEKYLKFLKIFSSEKQYINIIEYLKNIKEYIKLLYTSLHNSDIKRENYISDIENLKLEYKKISKNIKELFEEYDNITSVTNIEKSFYESIIKDLKFFMFNMIKKIQIFYKFNLTYNKENKNEITPEIGQPLLPTFYILTPFIFKKDKEPNFEKIKKFKVKGYTKYIYPVFEQIYDNWYGNIEKLIKFYEKEIKANEKESKNNEEIKMKIIKLELLKTEAKKQKISNSSIETKLLDIFEIHKFEETIIIALWKEFTKLENLPTTKLSNLKYDNLVLWYALTGIGDVQSTTKKPVIGRPFDFNAGLPITLMYELEIENYKRKLKLKNTTEHELDEE